MHGTAGQWRALVTNPARPCKQHTQLPIPPLRMPSGHSRAPTTPLITAVQTAPRPSATGAQQTPSGDGRHHASGLQKTPRRPWSIAQARSSRLSARS
eukprot:8857458-Heterocapsa_arctica.AAC.1